jgi:hypothetical protein
MGNLAAPNTVPITPSNVQRWLAKVTAATTDKTGGTPTNLVLLGTATVGGPGGTMSDIHIKGTATNVAASLLIFIMRSAVYYLVGEIAMPATTSDAVGDISYDSNKTVLNDNLQAGDAVYVGCTQAQTVVFSANYSDF